VLLSCTELAAQDQTEGQPMGRSRVYCTLPANANRQHNTQAARSIPRDPDTRTRTRRTASAHGQARMPYLKGTRTRARAGPASSVTWTGNRIQGPIAVGM